MAIGLELKDRGALTGAGAGNGARCGLIDGHNVVAVDDLAGDAVHLGAAGGHVLLAAGQLDGGVGGEEVVFADIDDRELPQTHGVHRLVVGALVRRAVAEEADDHVRLLLHLEGQRSARRDGQVAADDGVGGHGADGDIAGAWRRPYPCSSPRPCRTSRTSCS